MQEPDAAANGERSVGNPIVEAFTERQQQLSIVLNSVTTMPAVVAGGLVPASLLDTFQLELRNYHQATAEALVAQLGSDAEQGLTPAAAAAKLKEVGRNVVKPPTPMPLWLQLFLITTTSGFAPLLWFATFWIFLSWQVNGDL